MGGNSVSKTFGASMYREIEVTKEEESRGINSFNGYFGNTQFDLISTEKSRCTYFIRIKRKRESYNPLRVWLVDRNDRPVSKYYQKSKKSVPAHLIFKKSNGKIGFSVHYYYSNILNVSHFSKITRKMLVKTQIKDSYITEGKFDGVPVYPKELMDKISKLYRFKVNFEIIHKKENNYGSKSSSFGFYYHLRNEKMFISNLDERVGANLKFLKLGLYDDLINNNQIYFMKFFDRNILLAYTKILHYQKIEGIRCSNEDQHTYFFAPILIKKGKHEVICQQAFEFPIKASLKDQPSRIIAFFDQRNSEAIGLLVLKWGSVVGVFDFDKKGFFLVLKFVMKGIIIDIIKNGDVLTVIDIEVGKNSEQSYDMRKFNICRERGSSEEFLIDEFLEFDFDE